MKDRMKICTIKNPQKLTEKEGFFSLLLWFKGLDGD